MKKTIVLIISLLFAGTLAAQPLQFGVKAGLTMLSTDVRSWNDAREKLKANDVGFTAGIVSSASNRAALRGFAFSPYCMKNANRQE